MFSLSVFRQSERSIGQPHAQQRQRATATRVNKRRGSDPSSVAQGGFWMMFHQSPHPHRQTWMQNTFTTLQCWKWQKLEETNVT